MRLVRLGRVGKNEDRNRGFRYGSGADRDSLIDDHLDRYPAPSDPVRTLRLKGARGKAPKTALAVDLKGRWNTVPRGVAVPLHQPQVGRLSAC